MQPFHPCRCMSRTASTAKRSWVSTSSVPSACGRNATRTSVGVALHVADVPGVDQLLRRAHALEGARDPCDRAVRSSSWRGDIRRPRADRRAPRGKSSVRAPTIGSEARGRSTRRRLFSRGARMTRVRLSSVGCMVSAFGFSTNAASRSSCRFQKRRYAPATRRRSPSASASSTQDCTWPPACVDKPGALQNEQVLGNRLQRHAVRFGELGDARRAVGEALHQRAARAVCQRMEHLVEAVLVPASSACVPSSTKWLTTLRGAPRKACQPIG